MNLTNFFLKNKLPYLYFSLTLLIMVNFMSCNSNKEVKNIWINSSKTDCVGISPMQCYQVKYATNENWQLFYEEIKGFVYEPGYIYELKVALEQISSENLPADKSSINYSLIEVISKKNDPTLRLNDLWLATHINKVSIPRSENMPQVEISIKDLRLMGVDGCNNIRTTINSVTENKLTLGPILGTKKLCPDMEIPTKFTQALESVTSYHFKDLILTFYNQEGLEVLKFLKID